MGIRNLMEEDSRHSIEDVLKYATEQDKYQYIWAQQLNKVILKRLGDVDLEPEKLVEARIFGEGCEIHIFCQDDWVAIETEHWKKEYFDETQKIKQADRQRFGSTLQIRHYIEFEEDGQAYVCGSCLNGWEA